MKARQTQQLPAPLLADTGFDRRVARLSAAFTGMDFSANRSQLERTMDEHLREGRRLRATAQAEFLRGLVRGVGRAFRDAAESLRQRRVRRIARDQLLAMDSSLLRDIGIERHQIDAAVRGLIDARDAGSAPPAHPAKGEVAEFGRAAPKPLVPHCDPCPDLAA